MLRNRDVEVSASDEDDDVGSAALEELRASEFAVLVDSRLDEICVGSSLVVDSDFDTGNPELVTEEAISDIENSDSGTDVEAEISADSDRDSELEMAELVLEDKSADSESDVEVRTSVTNSEIEAVEISAFEDNEVEVS